MVEYFQLLLTLGAMLLVLLSCVALIGRFILMPVLALAALPTYAAMIVLEYIISHHCGGKCPTLLQFKKPKTFWKKACMDFFAAYCALIGSLIAIKIFDFSWNGKTVDAGMIKLLENFSDSRQFFMIAIFWLFLLGVYIVSYSHGDAREHPLNKLEELAIPEWAKKIAERLWK